MAVDVDDIDVAALLAPVADPSIDLRDDYTPQSIYYRVRDARSEARERERSMERGTDDTPPDWRPVVSLAPQALALAKDLEVAAWYTEALLRLADLPGFTIGAQVMAGLVADHWDSLFPLPDEDGIATRVAPVNGLNGEGGRGGTLIQPLNNLVLFPRADGAPVPFWAYQKAADAAGLNDKLRAQRVAQGVLPFAELEKEARSVGLATLRKLRPEITAAVIAWDQLIAALLDQAGADRPSTDDVGKLLAEIKRVVGLYVPAEANADPIAELSMASDGDLTIGTSGTGITVAQGLAGAAASVANREQALRQLTELADFFRRTEPHSPLAYTLTEAIRRGRLTWPELLEEVVPDPAARGAILNSLGIKPVAE